MSEIYLKISIEIESVAKETVSTPESIVYLGMSVSEYLLLRSPPGNFTRYPAVISVILRHQVKDIQSYQNSSAYPVDFNYKVLDYIFGIFRGIVVRKK